MRIITGVTSGKDPAGVTLILQVKDSSFVFRFQTSILRPDYKNLPNIKQGLHRIGQWVINIPNDDKQNCSFYKLWDEKLGYYLLVWNQVIYICKDAYKIFPFRLKLLPSGKVAILLV